MIGGEKLDFGGQLVPWGALGPALGGEIAIGADHFGARGPLSWVLGCLWGPFGVLLGRLWAPKRRTWRPQASHRAIWGSKWPLEGSWGHFGGGFWLFLAIFDNVFKRRSTNWKYQKLKIYLNKILAPV